MIPPRRQRRNGMDQFWTLMIYLGICEEIHDNIRWSPMIRAVIANPKRVFVVVVALMMVLFFMISAWNWTDEPSSSSSSSSSSRERERGFGSNQIDEHHHLFQITEHYTKATRDDPMARLPFG